MDNNKCILVAYGDPGVRSALNDILASPPKSEIAPKGAVIFGEKTEVDSYCSP